MQLPIQLNPDTTIVSSTETLIFTSKTVLLHFAFSALLFSPFSGEHLLVFLLSRSTWMIFNQSNNAFKIMLKSKRKKKRLVEKLKLQLPKF